MNEILPPQKVRRTRRRRRMDRIDRQEIFDRVQRFYTNDMDDRAEDVEARIQRYAKYRMWTQGKEWPWPDCSDASVPDMMSHSGRMQDTIHNAVMQRRPSIGAQALSEVDKDKQRSVDTLLDYQFFTEQPGEDIIGEMAEAFVNDPAMILFVPWIKEQREITEARRFDPIPQEMAPADYFRAILLKEYPSAQSFPEDMMDPWDWTVTGDTTFRARFYTVGDAVEMTVERPVVIYDGPRVLPMDYDDVLYPARAGNLQPPGPSNPHGASHVILRSTPTIDEIRRLAKQGFYDMDPEDLEALESLAKDTTDDESKAQKDRMGGRTGEYENDKAKSHNKLTRLMCFDSYDLDGDGLDEEVVWTVILELKRVVRVRLLTEVFPLDPPRRPLMSKSMIPVRNRVGGISLLESMEGLHDLLKSMVDQTVDYGTIRNVPFFFYRASSSMKPETIRLNPGEGYPLGDPDRDVKFPQWQSGDPSFGLNMMTLVNQFEERLTMIGDFQFGRVPAGKSSALRTASGMSMLAGQGEARPERVLRRFFGGLAEVYEIMYGLDRAMLSGEKQIRILGPLESGENPFPTIGRTDINGHFQFDFDANVLNTSRMALQENLESLMQTYISDIAIQLGIIDPSGVYRLLKDYGRARGQDPDQYLKPPAPGADKRQITAEDAVLMIMNGQPPDGAPMEGPQPHLEKLMAFRESDEFGHLSGDQADVFHGYIQQVQQMVQAEQQQMQLAQAAQAFGAGVGGPNQGGRPPTQPPPSLENPQVNNELLDESMPGAGGGAQQ